MKNYFKLVIVTVIFSLFIAGCTKVNDSKEASEDTVKLGVIVGTLDDTWRTSVRNQLYTMAEENNVEINIWGSDNNQDTQNQNIDIMLKDNIDVLVVNPVNADTASAIIEKAKAVNIPVVFFNIEPSSENMNLWDKVYYVGAIAEKSGTLQGQILADYFAKKPVLDKTIDYVMLKGPDEHQDAILRTKYSVQSLTDAGFTTNELASQMANWDRGQANDMMKDLIAQYGDQIDCVIANNDDMALGAIDALKNAGYFTDNKYIPVVGVDATSSALKAIKEGTLLGTVLNDSINQGKAIFNLATTLAKHEEPSKENCGFPITDSKYIWVDYQMVTNE